MKIVVAEKIAASAIQALQDESGWTVVTPEQLGGNLAQALADADALIVRSAVDVNAALLRGAGKLRVIGRAGVGVDNIDLEAATKAGIAVMNTPGANAVAVAEHTLALMLALARHLPRADATTKAGKWEKKALQGTELRGKTLGIVGLGKIGLEVSKRARSFAMKVLGHDPFVAEAVARGHEIQWAALEEVYASADYLSLHVGLTPQTAGMINQHSLARMKRGVHIVNCARGELIDEAALAAALATRQVAGAALDVFSPEPPAGSPLLALDNVILTPHIAGSTYEAQDAVGVQIASQIREYLKHGVIQNAVNMPSLDYERYAQMRPYLALAEKMGAFLAILAAGSVREISIQYSGPVAQWNTELIRNAAIQGVLNQLVAARANVVNAAAMAKERGIEVHESAKPSEPGGGRDEITLRIGTPSSQREVRGSVFYGTSPRLLGVDNIDIEVPLEGKLIYLHNRDVPGVVGRLGTILGRNNINIGNFALGRNLAQGGAEAVAVIQVDSVASESVLNEIRQLAEVHEVRAVQL